MLLLYNARTTAAFDALKKKAHGGQQRSAIGQMHWKASAFIWD